MQIQTATLLNLFEIKFVKENKFTNIGWNLTSFQNNFPLKLYKLHNLVSLLNYKGCTTQFPLELQMLHNFLLNYISCTTQFSFELISLSMFY